MGSIVTTFLLLAALSAAIAGDPQVPVRCEVMTAPDAAPLSDFARAARLIVDAPLIVRARAVAVDSLPLGSSVQRSIGVRFEMVEVLKATSSVPSALIIAPASLGDQDEFNPHAVPYGTVRPSGLRGSCYATAYRRDAEYLLFLRSTVTSLTPYWAPLAPTNEELRGDKDPWLAWVRAHQS
jgi:hypothetical protein